MERPRIFRADPVLRPFVRRVVAAAVAAVVLFAAGVGCGGGGQDAGEAPTRRSGAAAPTVGTDEFDPVAHLGRVEAWRARRHESLTSPDGWLSLVGLYWLTQGPNGFGSDPDNELVYRGSPYDEGPLPGRIGTFLVEGETVRFRAATGVEVRSADDGSRGEPVAFAVVHAPGDAPPEAERLAWGPLTWYVIERQGELAVRLKSANSPVLEEFRGIDYFPVDEDWRLVGRLEPHAEEKTISVPNVLGGVYEHRSPGAAVFEIDGQTHRLDVWYDSPDDVELFTVFGDATNGDETYGGGRFLRIDPPDAEGRIVVDFNRAYNPPCAFTDYSTCPLPPPQNRLPVPVTAGEKDYRVEG